MRSIGIAVMVLGIGVACGGRTAAPVVTPPGATPGAQAAAPITLQEYDLIEKHVGDVFATLQQHVAAGRLDAAAQPAEELAVNFGEVERFWAQRKKADAAKWASDARTFATQVAGAAAAGDATKTKQALSSMQNTCTRCHRSYRQTSGDDYRVGPTAVPDR